MVVVETKDLVTDTHTWITYDRQQLLVSHKKLKCMCNTKWLGMPVLQKGYPLGLILPISIHTPGPSCPKDG